MDSSGEWSKEALLGNKACYQISNIGSGYDLVGKGIEYERGIIDLLLLSTRKPLSAEMIYLENASVPGGEIDLGPSGVPSEDREYFNSRFGSMEDWPLPSLSSKKVALNSLENASTVEGELYYMEETSPERFSEVAQALGFRSTDIEDFQEIDLLDCEDI